MGVRKQSKWSWGRIKSWIDTSVPGTLGLNMEKDVEVEWSVKVPAAVPSCLQSSYIKNHIASIVYYSSHLMLLIDLFYEVKHKLATFQVLPD